MNSLMKDQGDWVKGMHGLRTQLLDVLTEADLKFSLPGNTTLGEMFREEAEIEQSYADSFKSFTQTFETGKSDPALATDIAKLKAHFQQIDTELDAALNGLSEDEIKKNIERNGFTLDVKTQLGVYTQAVLIFFGKATIYYRAIPKQLPDNWKAWIG